MCNCICIFFLYFEQLLVPLALLTCSHYQLIIIIITVFNSVFYSSFCKKNPKRAACASLVEREEKGFEVAGAQKMKEKDYCL